MLLAAASTVGAAAGHASSAAEQQSAGHPASTSASPAARPAAFAALAVRLPGFAAALSEIPTIVGPQAWRPIPYEKSWAALAGARPDTRQALRWDYARSLIAAERGDDAVGVLDVMRQDDPDLALVPSWQLARGAALAQTGRASEALAALGGAALGGAALGGAPLAANPEACLWRMLAMAQAGLAQQALAQVACALPALDARPAGGRVRFVLAASRAAIEARQPALALKWLALVSDGDPAANLYRGKAYLALGQAQAGRLRLERVQLRGTPEQRMDAKLSLVEAEAGAGKLPPVSAMKQLDHIRFTWRGGDIEERTLRLGWRLSTDAHDERAAMAAGATLFRYFDLGADAAPMMAGFHAQFVSALAPDSKTPIDQAAGLYWDFRDLAPAGAEGDQLVYRLADRLQAAGLYARAAELLQYQLSQRVKDIAQGPLSVKVAILHILAGRPDRALQALRDTDGIAYPQEMLWDRRRVGAAALHLLGKTAEALAVLQDVPDGNRIRAEIYWKTQDWAGLVSAGEPALPGPGPLSEVEQAMVLRHAIALAMLGREDGLSGLRARYGASFAKLPSAATFDVLTRAVETIDPAAIAQAMAALPSASPAGKIGDLLDADVAGAKRPG